MPLYHSSAALLGFGNTLETGGTIALGRKFSTKTFWADVRETKATMIQYVGETCRYLLAAPPQLDPVTGENLDRKHSVRVAFGNGLRPDIWDRFKDRFGIDTIAEFYAATEGTFGTWNLSRNDFSRGAIGRFGWLYRRIMAFAGDITVAIVETDHTTDIPVRDPKTGFCKRVALGEPGELLCKLPADDIGKRFQGYYGNDKATTDKIARGVFKANDAWFRTGDVVRWDADGRFFFMDRMGDTFRWKSENVSTAEVAQAVGTHPAVQEANVYGVQLPHHDGRAGCAAIVLGGSAGDGNGSGDKRQEPNDALLRSLATHLSTALPRYALPLFLRVVPSLGAQTTGTNKQQKHVLRAQGVSPAKTAPDRVYWFRGGTYVPFGKRDWHALRGGRVKL
jgi:acyl-CoA synthetase (AMP-forming)/AMP-acid ligase II